MTMTERAALAALLSLALLGCTSQSDPPAAVSLPQVVVLGFDGVDPDRVEALWAEGALPHLKRLGDSGHFGRLGTTQPPQSPVAWASFATGTLPGKHGVYDFIARKPESYRQNMGALEYRPPRCDAD